MPRPRLTLDREDVLRVAAKVAEVAPPPSRRKVAEAFGISPNGLTQAAKHGGWLDELDAAMAPQARPVDEALEAVKKLVS